MSNNVKQGPIYENCTIFAPDGTALCRTNSRKLKWYLDRDLADVVAIRLRFEPKGRKNAEDPYYLSDKQNRCVVCGSSDGLNHHHVVPRCYRRHFPDGSKNHTSHDVLPLCVACHEAYEPHASHLKKQMGEECGHVVKGVDHGRLKVRKAAHAVRHYWDNIPETRRNELYAVVRDYLGKEPTDEDLANLENLETFNDAIIDQFKVVVDKMDIQKLSERWRRHFIDTMKPKFLPDGWDILRKEPK